MAEIFQEQANLFSRARGGVKIKPESEISRHNTLASVISGLFHTRYLFTTLLSTRGRVTHSVKLVVGATHTPS